MGAGIVAYAESGAALPALALDKLKSDHGVGAVAAPVAAEHVAADGSAVSKAVVGTGKLGDTFKIAESAEICYGVDGGINNIFLLVGCDLYGERLAFGIPDADGIDIDGVFGVVLKTGSGEHLRFGHRLEIILSIVSEFALGGIAALGGSAYYMIAVKAAAVKRGGNGDLCAVGGYVAHGKLCAFGKIGLRRVLVALLGINKGGLVAGLVNGINKLLFGVVGVCGGLEEAVGQEVIGQDTHAVIGVDLNDMELSSLVGVLRNCTLGHAGFHFKICKSAGADGGKVILPDGKRVVYRTVAVTGEMNDLRILLQNVLDLRREAGLPCAADIDCVFKMMVHEHKNGLFGIIGSSFLKLLAQPVLNLGGVAVVGAGGDTDEVITVDNNVLVKVGVHVFGVSSDSALVMLMVAHDGHKGGFFLDVGVGNRLPCL